MRVSVSYRFRQLAVLGLTANALRPIPGMPASVPAFFAGWLTSELAPQLLAATLVDSAVHVVRHGRRDGVALAASAFSVAGLAAVISAGRGAAAEVEDALAGTLGPYSSLESAIDRVPWRTVAYPFRMRHADVVKVRNLDYALGGKRFRMDIFHHRDIPANAPILLQIHGGGWVTSNKDHQGIPLMLEMASRGWVCAAINYPLSPRAKWPAHLIAAKQAIAWLREHAADYGASPEFVAVTGGSAGGHIAAMVALTANDPALQPGFESADTSVQACVPHYGAYDFAGETGLESVRLRVESGLMPMVLGKNPRHPEDFLAASPYAHVHADAPPFFVVHGSNDSLIPVGEARAFVERLRAVSRNPVAYAELRGGQHAFDVFPSIRSIHVVRGVARFLEHAAALPVREFHPSGGTKHAQG